MSLLYGFLYVACLTTLSVSSLLLVHVSLNYPGEVKVKGKKKVQISAD